MWFGILSTKGQIVTVSLLSQKPESAEGTRVLIKSSASPQSRGWKSAFIHRMEKRTGFTSLENEQEGSSLNHGVELHIVQKPGDSLNPMK